MKYAVVVKTSSGRFVVHSTSATENGANRQYSRLSGAGLTRGTVFVVLVDPNVRRDDELDSSCLERRVRGLIYR